MSFPDLTTPSTDPSLPISKGSLAEFSRDVLGGLLRLHEEHGPIAALEDGSQRVVFSFDPAINRQVLINTPSFEARFFAVRGPKRSSQRRVTCGLLAMNGEQWKRNRRLVKDPFNMKLVSAYRPAITKLAEETAAAWKIGDEFDFNEEMVRYLLRVTSTLLFGMNDNEADRRLAYEVGEQIADWVQLNHDVGVGAMVPDDTFSAKYEDLLRFAEGLESQVAEMIARRRAAAHGCPHHQQQANDVLSILVRTNERGTGLTDAELIGQSCVLFGAAHMTTSHSITWTTFLLSQHPQAMRRLAAELATHDPLAEADPQSCLERSMREGMRLLPASSYSLRVTNQRLDLGPFKDLPRGTPVIFSPFITHRLEPFYSQPKRFDPDRWETLKPPPYAYIPFGGGPRLCLGSALAMEVIRTSLPIFFRGRGFRVCPGADVTAQILSTMLNPMNGMPMQVVPEGEYAASPIAGNLPELVDFGD